MIIGDYFVVIRENTVYAKSIHNPKGKWVNMTKLFGNKISRDMFNDDYLIG